MLFSAWQATTQASQPVQRSRSTIMPQRCSINNSSFAASATRTFVRQPGIPTEENEPAFARPCDLHARRCPGERSRLSLHHWREDRRRIRPTLARIARVVLVTLTHGHCDHVGSNAWGGHGWRLEFAML